MAEQTYEGRCFCGAVQFTVTDNPEAMGYCHCHSCRAWAAAPINAFTLWTPENLTVTRGKDQIGVFHLTAQSHRQFCRTCGGHFMTAHPPWNLVDVYAAVIPGFRFAPKVHVHYGESVLPMRDGLPKFKDVPRKMGGSGVLLPE